MSAAERIAVMEGELEGIDLVEVLHPYRRFLSRFPSRTILAIPQAAAGLVLGFLGTDYR